METKTPEQDVVVGGIENKPKKRSTREYVIYGASAALGYAVVSLLFTLYINPRITGQTAQNDVNNLASYYANTSTWKQFDSAIGNFQVMFPTYPTHQSQSALIPNTNTTLTYDTYSSDGPNNISYIVGVSKYPTSTNVSNPKNNLESALNGMIQSNQGNQLLSSQMDEFDNYPSVDFIIRNDQASIGTIFLQGRAFLVGYTMYEQMFIYPSSSYNTSTYNQFINSFKLVNP